MGLHGVQGSGCMDTVPKSDHFPTTRQTWILDRLAEGEHGLHPLRDHIMTRYREPLLIYARGSTLRTLGEPDELVHGFFAAFFSRQHALERWAESGTRLRRWMMNGLVLHARGIRRDMARDRETTSMDLVATRPVDDRTAEQRFEEAWARSLLSDAATAVQAELYGEGRPAAWDVFAQHIIEGRSYAECCPQFGYTVSDGRTVTRMVSIRIRRTLRELLLQEGTPEHDIDAELRALEGLLDR
jgi:hypothetical protein